MGTTANVQCSWRIAVISLKPVVQMHLTFHRLHVQFRARHMDCVLIPTDCGLMGLGVSE